MRAVLVIVAVAAMAAAGCAESGGSSFISCAPVVRWNQTLYFGHALKVRHGDVLGRGVVPACSTDDEDQEVTLRRVGNVPPRSRWHPTMYPQRRDLVAVRGRRCDPPDSGRAYVGDVIAPAD